MVRLKLSAEPARTPMVRSPLVGPQAQAVLDQGRQMRARDVDEPHRLSALGQQATEQSAHRTRADNHDVHDDFPRLFCRSLRKAYGVEGVICRRINGIRR